MSKIERDLRTRLDWVTVDHFDTGHPHTRGATWLDRQLVRKDRSASAV